MTDFNYRDRKTDEELIEGAKAGRNNSIYPSWHTKHICGMYCDGQDGMGSRCSWEKQVGPPPWYDAAERWYDAAERFATSEDDLQRLRKFLDVALSHIVADKD